MSSNPTVLPESPLDLRMAVQPPWKVLLHNDDYHAMDYVIGALCKAVPGMSTEEAMRIMFEAHFNEVGLVTVCPKEQAEYFQERIQSYGLGCSIEPGD